MANLPNDTLPGEFDVIVVGTGLVQCIVAAAAARIGKSVLHLDGNPYYGDLWGTLMHRDLCDWISQHGDGVANDEGNDPVIPTPNEGEVFIPCDNVNKITNIIEINHGSSIEETPPITVAADPPEAPSLTTKKPDVTSLATDAPPDVTSPATEAPPDVTSPATEAPPNVVSPTTEAPPDKVTWDSLASQRRRFNFDLLPKLLHCRGKMVDVIVDSGVSRYLEFKSIPKLYCFTNERQIVQVPCSRSDVFNSKIVTMLDKRKLMKILTFCVDYEQDPSVYQDYVDRPFVEFLRSRDLNNTLIHFIVHSIAMVHGDATTIEGLNATRVFLQSLGRFGNAPFLYPLFGCGELPQAFCRLCAVFGGVYCLKRSVHSLITTNNSVCGIVCTAGQRIKCSVFVGSAGLLPNDHISDEVISRAIFITDGPISNTDEKIHLLTVPPLSLSSDQANRILALQVDESSLNTSANIFMVHGSCVRYSNSAVDDLKCLSDELFITGPHTNETNKPNLLWSLYYNVNVSKVGSCAALPENVFMVSDPDSSVGYESCVSEAKALFNQLFPGEDFLPKIPDPEDIIYGDNEEQEDVPANDDLINKQEDVPANDELINKQEDVPANDDLINKQEDVPANDDLINENQ